MFSLYSKKIKNDLSVLIDIQSGLVRGALILEKDGDLPHILYVVTKTFTIKTHTNSTYITKMMLKMLSIVINSIENEGIIKAQSLGYNRKALNSIHYIFSSPWIISKSKSIKIEYENNKEITEKDVHNIISDEQKKIEAQFIGEYSHLVSIEQKILEVKLNGYVTNNFNKRNAKTLEISFAITLISKDILDKIHSVIKKSINCHKEYYHSALLLQFITLQSLFNKKEDFISIHVHNELTDIIVVKKGFCVTLSSFPFGISTLLRKISHSLKNNDETSNSILSLYQEGKLENNEENKFKKVIDPLINAWYIELLKLINKDDKDVMPRLIYLSAHNYLKFFKSVFLINNTEKYEIVSTDTLNINSHIVYEKISEKSRLMEIYVLALKNMI